MASHGTEETFYEIRIPEIGLVRIRVFSESGMVPPTLEVQAAIRRVFNESRKVSKKYKRNFSRCFSDILKDEMRESHILWDYTPKTIRITLKNEK